MERRELLTPKRLCVIVKCCSLLLSEKVFSEHNHCTILTYIFQFFLSVNQIWSTFLFYSAPSDSYMVPALRLQVRPLPSLRNRKANHARDTHLLRSRYWGSEGRNTVMLLCHFPILGGTDQHLWILALNNRIYKLKFRRHTGRKILTVDKIMVRGSEFHK